MNQKTIFINPNYCMGNRSILEKIWIAWSAFLNPWLMIPDKLGLIKHPVYHSERGMFIETRGKTTDVNDVVVVISGNEYPEQLMNISQKAAPVVLDCGGHIGSFTLYAKSLNPQAKVIVLEPVAENLSLLQRNVDRNHLTDVVIAPYGIYTHTGTVSFDTKDKPLDAGHVTDDGEGTMSVQVKTLDDICIEHNLQRIDLMKIDIEGAEFPLVEHSVGKLSEVAARIVMEFHPWVKDGARDFLVSILTTRGSFDLIYETKNVLGFSNRNLE